MRKDTDNKLGDAVSVEQLQSDQPGLIQQLSGKITIARIWDAQVTADHFSNLTYVHLMRSTSQ